MTVPPNTLSETLISLTSDIVCAHVGNNNIGVGELPLLIGSVYEALVNLGQPVSTVEDRQEPAVSVRASIKPDYIVCLEDGKKLKMLKRYLRTNFDMSPEQYRARWGLPLDYPMVAPSYAEKRRVLAKQIGLGRRKAVPAPAPARKNAKSAKATPSVEKRGG